MNGYYQLDLNGEKIGLKFGLVANQLIFEKASVSKLFQQDTTFYSPWGLAKILHSGYVNNCERKNEVQKFDFETFYDLIEDDFYEGKLRKDIESAINEFNESRFVKKLVENSKEVPISPEEEKKNKKKNLIGKKPKPKP